MVISVPVCFTNHWRDIVVSIFADEPLLKRSQKRIGHHTKHYCGQNKLGTGLIKIADRGKGSQNLGVHRGSFCQTLSEKKILWQRDLILLEAASPAFKGHGLLRLTICTEPSTRICPAEQQNFGIKVFLVDLSENVMENFLFDLYSAMSQSRGKFFRNVHLLVVFHRGRSETFSLIRSDKHG